MKKTLLIAFLLIPLIGFTQTTKPIDGFLGIKFGTSKAAVIETMKSKGAAIDSDDPSNETVTFKNVSLGHRQTVTFFVRFVNNKAFEADYFFDPGLEAKTIEYYNDLLSDLTDVYGKGESFKNFKEPYKDGDGYETTAIASGKADYVTFWEDAANNKNSISLKIQPNLHVKLVYQDAVLVEEAIAKQKAKEKSDF